MSPPVKVAQYITIRAGDKLGKTIADFNIEDRKFSPLANFSLLPVFALVSLPLPLMRRPLLFLALAYAIILHQAKFAGVSLHYCLDSQWTTHQINRKFP